jgi:hypothetical protein
MEEKMAALTDLNPRVSALVCASWRMTLKKAVDRW